MDKDHPLPPDPVAGLIDIPLPPSVSLWPQTLASRALCVLILIALAFVFGRTLYVWHRNRYRREALASLKKIVQEQSGTAVTELAALVRRTALVVFPRQTIAEQTGDAWLAFLDRSYGGHEFSSGAGRILSLGPYASDRTTSLFELSDLVRRWIRTHHV